MVGQLEPAQLEDAIGLAWRCTHDGFERNLGPLHETTLLCYIDYIVWIHGSTDHSTEESLLRDVLTRCETVYGHYSEMTLTINSRIAESLYEQKRLLESETLALEVVRRARVAAEDVQLILALELASMAEYDLREYELAERHLREGMAVCERLGNGEHPWIIKTRAKLEGWLREWGRDDEADRLKVEVDDLIGLDDIDEEIGQIGEI